MVVKDFFREIRKNLGRFFSMFFIVALGAAFFAGLRSTGYDMKISADAYYDEQKLMDIQVIGTLGLTDEDLSDIRAMDGVESAVGNYTKDVLWQDADKERVMHAVARTDDINIAYVTEGRLPERPDECLLDSGMIFSSGSEIGSTVTIRPGNPDEDLSDFFTQTTFTIVGKGYLPYYTDLSRGTSSIGSGTVSAFLLLDPAAFDMDVYTEIYVSVEGARDKVNLSDEYKDTVSKVFDQIDKFSDKANSRRYNNVFNKASDEINDAKEEISDGWKEVEDGWKELHDAKEELDDGWRELRDAIREIQDNQKKLNDGRAEIDKNRTDLDDGWKELNDGQKKLDDGLAEWQDGWRKLQEGKAELAENIATYEDGVAELKKAEKDLKKAKRKLEKGRPALEEGKIELEKAWKDLEAGQEKLEAARNELSDAWSEIRSGKRELEAGQKELDEGWAQFSAAKPGLVQNRGDLERQIVSISDSIKQLEQTIDSLQEGDLQKDSLNDQLSLAKEGLAQAQAGLEQVNAGLAQENVLIAGQARLDAAQAQLEAGEEELRAGEKEFLANEEKLNEGRKELEANQKEFDEKLKEFEDGERQIKKGEKEIKKSKKELKEAKEKLDEAKITIADSEKELKDALKELQDGQAEIDDNRKKLEDGDSEIADAIAEIEDGQKKINDANKDVASGRRDLIDGQNEYDDAYDDAVADLNDAEKELHDAEEEVADAEEELRGLAVPSWYVLDREMMIGVVGYDQNAERMDSLGNVFPVIFFLVAALVSLTAMTRMVDEQRMQIGTMKALGYGHGVIAGRYFWYAMLATVSGAVLGIAIGEFFLPYFIASSYGVMYTGMPLILLPINWNQTILALAASVGSTGIATLAACANQLRSNPASLMRPESPKNGSRVFMERIPFIWKHLAFSVKSTIRNLFRYKKRFIMTIIGVGGCMALLLVGFGIKDSIQVIAQQQYINIFKYEAYVTVDTDKKQDKQDQVYDKITSYEGVTGAERIHLGTVDLFHGKNTRSSYMLVAQDSERISDFLSLKDRVSGQVYDYPETGAAIAEKTAKMLGVNVGDSVIIRDDGYEASVEITTIVENYIQHYILLSESTYKTLFGELPKYNTIYINYNEKSEDEEAEMGRSLMALDACTGITFVTDLGSDIDDMLGILNSVVWILIASAGLLAFIVLYNLNSINIMERRREIATLKVLGFYDTEVSMYIFRENIVLSLLGIVLGLFMGTILHSYTITTVEVDLMMFGRNISLLSYALSSLITLLFSVLVNLYMHFSLKRINMIESLKSVE